MGVGFALFVLASRHGQSRRGRDRGFPGGRLAFRPLRTAHAATGPRSPRPNRVSKRSSRRRSGRIRGRDRRRDRRHDIRRRHPPSRSPGPMPRLSVDAAAPRRRRASRRPSSTGGSGGSCGGYSAAGHDRRATPPPSRRRRHSAGRACARNGGCVRSGAGRRRSPRHGRSTSCSSRSRRARTPCKSSSSAPTINKLYNLAQGVIPQLAQIPGVIRPDTNVTARQPEVDVNIDRRRAAQLGLRTGDRGQHRSRPPRRGTIASYYQINGIQYPIFVELPPSNERRSYSLRRAACRLTPPTTAGRRKQLAASRFRASPTIYDRQRPLADQPPEQAAPHRHQRDGHRPAARRCASTTRATIMNAIPLPRGYRWAIRPDDHAEQRHVLRARPRRAAGDRVDLHAARFAVRIVSRPARHHDVGPALARRHRRLARHHAPLVRAHRVHRVR